MLSSSLWAKELLETFECGTNSDRNGQFVGVTEEHDWLKISQTTRKDYEIEISEDKCSEPVIYVITFWGFTSGFGHDRIYISISPQ